MKDLLPVRFVKMSGAGNTFVLIDARDSSPWQALEKKIEVTRPAFVKKICDPVNGVGADGALFIESPSPGFDFDWDFYNSDGSTAEMCGNVSRCAARFCHQELEATSDQLIFKTGAGAVRTRTLDDGRIEVKMPEARWIQRDLLLRTQGAGTERFTWVDTGVPHLVRPVNSLAEAFRMKEMAKEVRSHKDLGPPGANVTFYAVGAPGQIHAVSFERGVENYTLACGTGAVAAALVYNQGRKPSVVEVIMPGGTLLVEFQENDPYPLMTGEATVVCEFEYSFEVLK